MKNIERIFLFWRRVILLPSRNQFNKAFNSRWETLLECLYFLSGNIATPRTFQSSINRIPFSDFFDWHAIVISKACEMTFGDAKGAGARWCGSVETLKAFSQWFRRYSVSWIASLPLFSLPFSRLHILKIKAESRSSSILERMLLSFCN